MQTKYIFITGGVVSGLGKGIAAASIGALLESRGLTVSLMKLDPYINVDAGTMNPFQHGEVFVTVDGAETDLDLGHYERYTNAVLTRRHNRTTGQIYDTVIRKERAGDYLGATVQVVPHVIDEIKNTITEASRIFDKETKTFTTPTPTFVLWKSAELWETSSHFLFWKLFASSGTIMEKNTPCLFT